MIGDGLNSLHDTVVDVSWYAVLQAPARRLRAAGRSCKIDPASYRNTLSSSSFSFRDTQDEPGALLLLSECILHGV
jgi:hypothetical protein